MKRRAALASALAACVAGCGPAPQAQARPKLPALPVRDFTGQAKTHLPASGSPQVQLVARISRTGNAMPQPGDLTGSLGPVKVGARDVKLVISEVVK